MGSVARAIPSRLSFEAFNSLVEPADTCTASLDTQTPAAQEVLGHRVLQSLDEERRESQRYRLHFYPPNMSRGSLTLVCQLLITVRSFKSGVKIVILQNILYSIRITIVIVVLTVVM